MIIFKHPIRQTPKERIDEYLINLARHNLDAALELNRKLHCGHVDVFGEVIAAPKPLRNNVLRMKLMRNK